MEQLSYFWINDNELSVNGVKMTPEKAYKLFPNQKKEIQSFVEKTKLPIRKLNQNLLLDETELAFAPHETKNKTDISQIIIDLKREVASVLTKNGIEPGKQFSNAQKFENAFKLFKYVIENSKYEDAIMEEKSQTGDYFEMCAIDAHRCLCKHRSVCTSDATALSLLFEQAGISSQHLTIAEIGSTPKGVHEVVSFNIGEKKFICDPTLVRTALENHNIPEVHPSVFAFTPNDFFDTLYPTKEIKFEHDSLKI